MPKFKSAVMKFIACPRCGEKYEVRLGPDESTRSGVQTCAQSRNKAFARNGFIWCGATVVYEVTRSYTHVAVVEWCKQPNRFRRVHAGKVRLSGLDPNAHTVARWYCVSRDWIATLCVDEEDARANAAHCDQAWPAGGPHRAVQMVDSAHVTDLLAAERDMCAMECWHLAHKYMSDPDDDGVEHWLREAESAIRARGADGALTPSTGTKET